MKTTPSSRVPSSPTPVIDRRAAWRGRRRAVLAALMLLAGAFLAIVVGRSASNSSSASLPKTTPAERQVREAYGKLPLSFEANQGQAPEEIDFVARGPGYRLALQATGAVFVLTSASTRDDDATGVRQISNAPSETHLQSRALQMTLGGGNSKATAEGLRESEGKVNYFIGSDPTKWRRNVPTFGLVRYPNVYPGIDVVYYGNNRRLEYDFVIAPGGDPKTIALEFSGAERVEVDNATGDLLLQVGENTIRQFAPMTYQETSAGRRTVESRYAMKAGGRVGFEVGAYDTSAPLVIDPVLVYSTYLSGASGETARGIAVDSAGNAYVSGQTSSSNFPTVNAFQSTRAGLNDVFITKFNAAGSALIYSTYLGGSSTDSGIDLAVDSDGNAYVTGSTLSTNFPIVNAVQSTYSGQFGDAFVTKLNATGAALVYSTYLGGSVADSGEGIAADASGNAYITGITRSSNFPTANALQSTSGGGSDAFVTKLSAAGAFIYSTYLGGTVDDDCRDIVIDLNGSAYITGTTYSTNFPLVAAFQATKRGLGDVFVTKFNAAGSALVYSTYLGGGNPASANEDGYSIEVDSSGNAYVTGLTGSTDFPTANALQGTNGGGTSDVFVTKLNAAGSALIYSTYLGGTGKDEGHALAVGPDGNAYVTGRTFSNNFPVANPSQGTIGGIGDAFVTKLNTAGTALIYSTYLGGSNNDWGLGIAVDAAGNAYVTGETQSANFPVANAFQSTRDPASGQNSTVFVTKISHTPTSTAQPQNISTRMRVLTGDSALIGGFIITGSSSKRVIVRALGPSLADFGIAGALTDPVLELNGPAGFATITNDNWRDTQQIEIEGTGIPPGRPQESAIVAMLPPGAYTAIVRGQNNGTGVGLVEVYDLQPEANARLANISTRGFVDTGENVMIGGLISGPATSASARMLVRAIGPSLSPFGVPNALQDPTLELRDGNGALLLSNDDWRDTQQIEIEQTLIPPSHPKESAILATLAPGAYTVIVRGAGNTTGVGLVEVYNLQ